MKNPSPVTHRWIKILSKPVFSLSKSSGNLSSCKGDNNLGMYDPLINIISTIKSGNVRANNTTKAQNGNFANLL